MPRTMVHARGSVVVVVGGRVVLVVVTGGRVVLVVVTDGSVVGGREVVVVVLVTVVVVVGGTAAIVLCQYDWRAALDASTTRPVVLVTFCFVLVGLLTSSTDALAMNGVPAPDGKATAFMSLSL